MTNRLWMLSVKIQNLLSREEGQDLIEYALIVALISLAATAGMKALSCRRRCVPSMRSSRPGSRWP